jgi:DNA helicase-2/ATP-dependent DNA helicase PcrA
MNICKKRAELIEDPGNILVLGGPGSGKTTISLIKANHTASTEIIESGQKILFLSFARSTVSRIQEHTSTLIDKQYKYKLEINTYHGFIWKLLQSFSYLLNGSKTLQLLTPAAESALFSELEDDKEIRKLARKELFKNEGLLSFDIFSEVASGMLQKSQRILKLICDRYPIIIVDEFQDTDDNEWELIKTLGIYSTIIALADPEQRIYDFRGASTERIDEFIKQFNPSIFDFEQENNRSNGKDIIEFGNDLLRDTNKGKIYRDVIVKRYDYAREQNIPLKYALLDAIKRLKKSKGDDWSIAVLVRTKRMMLSVSSYLATTTSLPSIYHEVAIDPNGPALAGIVIAGLLEPTSDISRFISLVNDIKNHIKGRTGSKISMDTVQFITALDFYIGNGKIKGSKRILFIKEMQELLAKREDITLCGIPEDDWLQLRRLFQNCESIYLKNIYEDVKFLRLLKKGALLSERLTATWRLTGTYQGAKASIEDAFVQEHFIAAQTNYKGIHIMTLHKSKGKEFDEVFIWEDFYNPLVRPDSKPKDIIESRYLLRVAATRSRERTTFLTVAKQPCILL